MEKIEIKKECLNQAIRVHHQVSGETAVIGGSKRELINNPKAILKTAKLFEKYITS